MLLIAAGVAVVLYYLYNYARTGSIGNVGELVYGDDVKDTEEEVEENETNASATGTGTTHRGSDAAPVGAEDSAAAAENYTSGCYPKGQLSPDELMPKDSKNAWSDVNPSDGALGGMNFLNAGWNVGIDSVGQTNRNPNYQLRSEPANPQVAHSIFLNTTIEPDTHRRPFELGGCN